MNIANSGFALLLLTTMSPRRNNSFMYRKNAFLFAFSISSYPFVAEIRGPLRFLFVDDGDPPTMTNENIFYHKSHYLSNVFLSLFFLDVT